MAQLSCHQAAKHPSSKPHTMYDMSAVDRGEVTPVLSPSGLLLGYALRPSNPAEDGASVTSSSAGHHASQTAPLASIQSPTECFESPAGPVSTPSPGQWEHQQLEGLAASISMLKGPHAQVCRVAAELQDLVRMLSHQLAQCDEEDTAAPRDSRQSPYSADDRPMALVESRRDHVSDAFQDATSSHEDPGSQETRQLRDQVETFTSRSTQLGGNESTLEEDPPCAAALEVRCQASQPLEQDSAPSREADASEQFSVGAEPEPQNPQLPVAPLHSDMASLELMERLGSELAALREQLGEERGLTAAAEREKSVLKRRVKEAEFASSLLQQQAASMESERLALKQQLDSLTLELAQERLRQNDHLEALVSSEAAARAEIVSLSEDLRARKTRDASLEAVVLEPLFTDPALSLQPREELQKWQSKLEGQILVTEAAFERVANLEQGLQIALKQVRSSNLLCFSQAR